jgi:uncharacterized protein (DUF2132 family)
MTEKEATNRKKVIAHYRLVAKEWATEKVRDAYLQHAQRLENELQSKELT